MWFWYALSSAIISGVSVVLNKKILNNGVHSSVLSSFLFLFSTVGGLFFLIFNQSGIDSLYIFYISAIVSAVAFALAKNIQLGIFKKNNLSEIYPLASLSPLILYLIGLITLNEIIKTTAFIGLLIMVFGVYLINYKSDNKDILHPLKHLFTHKSSMLYIFAMILSSMSALAEKKAILATINNNIFYLAFWENLFLTIITSSYVLKTNKNWFSEIKSNIKNLVIAGLIFSTLYFLVMSGFKEGPVALVSAVKKFEVLVVLILSVFFFKEKPSKFVYLGSILMLIAVFLIKL